MEIQLFKTGLDKMLENRAGTSVFCPRHPLELPVKAGGAAFNTALGAHSVIADPKASL